MKEILQFNVINELKKITRMNSVGKRKGSVAEHTWSSMMLADFFLEKEKLKIDRLKVYELLMYHDLLEIETGDIPILPELKNIDKEEIEKKAKKIFCKKIPEYHAKKFKKLSKEFEERVTLESRFANAVDKLDVIIQILSHKTDLKGWSKKSIIEKKQKYFVEFPEINKKFKNILKSLECSGHLSKE